LDPSGVPDYNAVVEVIRTSLLTAGPAAAD